MSLQPNMKLAIRRVTEALAPAPDAEVEEALVALQLSTGAAKREANEEDAAYADEMKLERYTAKCRAYPSDVVLHTLATWDDDHEFFPRWAELRRRLESRSHYRRCVLVALQAFEAPVQKDAPDPINDEAAEERSLHARTVYLDFCRRTGTRPNPNLLPPGVEPEFAAREVKTSHGVQPLPETSLSRHFQRALADQRECEGLEAIAQRGDR